MSSIKHTTELHRFTDEGHGYKTIATYGVDETNWRYFFVSFNVWNKYASINSNPIGAGGGDDFIRRNFPQLRDILALQMSDAETGEPLHAEANGWHWLRHYGARSMGVEHAAHLLRTTVDRVEGITTREEFAALVESLRPQWAEEARAIRAKYDLN